MNDDYIVTVYSVIDDLLKAHGYEDDKRTKVSAAEILTVAVVAAKYFQNHHERTLCVLIKLRDIPRLSVSRFNRRLHALKDWLYGIVSLLGNLFTEGTRQSLLWLLCRQTGEVLRLALASDLHRRWHPRCFRLITSIFSGSHTYP